MALTLPWAHTRIFAILFCGPNQTCVLYTHNGPTWVFPISTVHIHMGSTNNYGQSLQHGLMGRSSRLCGGKTYTRYAGIVPSLAERNLETSDQGVQAVPPSLRATTLCPIIPNTTAHPTLFSTATSPHLSGRRCSITSNPSVALSPSSLTFIFSSEVASEVSLYLWNS